MKRTIVCAAMRHAHTGTIICSPRHFDERCAEVVGYTQGGWHDAEQGFVDQHGVFFSRTEAWRIAAKGCQIVRRCGGDTTDGGTLYSENLY